MSKRLGSWLLLFPRSRFVMVVRNLWDAATKLEEGEGGRVDNLGCFKGGGGGSREGLSDPTGEE
jgi:hypothetical protein